MFDKVKPKDAASMEQTKWEKQIINQAERSTFNSFWAKIHLLDGWKSFVAISLIYTPIFLLFSSEGVFKPSPDFLGIFSIMLIILFSISSYRQTYVIKKLSERVKELEKK